MAPLSIVPGRVRFESPRLRGQAGACSALEGRIAGLEGVLAASVNHRTGRVLVRFDEGCIDRLSLMDSITALEESCAAERQTFPPPVAEAAQPSRALLAHALMDVIAHSLLPRPLNLLVPLAVHSMRK